MPKLLALLACLSSLTACDTMSGQPARQSAHTYEITNSLVPGEPSTITGPAGCRLEKKGERLEKICD
jgi:hypothetical protein